MALAWSMNAAKKAYPHICEETKGLVSLSSSKPARDTTSVAGYLQTNGISVTRQKMEDGYGGGYNFLE